MTKTQVGRGGKRGKTSGRGTKGQKARAGHKIRPEIRDQIKKIPKMRGRGIHGNKSIKLDNSAINIDRLDALFNDGDTISPATLSEKKMIKRIGGNPEPVKILASGETKKKFTVEGCSISISAKNKLEKAGGKVVQKVGSQEK